MNGDRLRGGSAPLSLPRTVARRHVGTASRRLGRRDVVARCRRRRPRPAAAASSALDAAATAHGAAARPDQHRAANHSSSALFL